MEKRIKLGLVLINVAVFLLLLFKTVDFVSGQTGNPPNDAGQVLRIGTDGSLVVATTTITSASGDIIFNPVSNIGIGDLTIALQKLHVKGNVLVNGTIWADYFVGSFGGGSSVPARLISTGVFGQDFGTVNYDFSGKLGIGTTADPMFLPQPLSVYGGGYFQGNVGIGTTAPQSLLDISSASNANQLRLTNTAVGGKIWDFVSETSGVYSIIDRSNNVRRISVGSGAAGDFNFFNNAGGNLVTILESSGKVGIGTIAPIFKLQVVAGSSDGIAVGQAVGTNPQVLISDEGDYARIQSFNGPLSINPLGNNVGIATTTPTSPLTVYGTIFSSTGGFKFPDQTIQTTAAGGGSQWTTNGSDIYYNTGNVGIGESVPQEKLHVAGNLRLGTNPSITWGANNLDLKSSGGSIGVVRIRGDGTYAPRFEVYNADNTSVSLFVRGDGYVGVGAASVDTSYKITTSGGGIKADSNTTPAGYFSSVSGHGLIVNRGNVGIGMSDPGSPLTMLRTIEGTVFAIRNTANSLDTFTISDTGTITLGSVPWARLTVFPASCTSGQFVSALGTTLTCGTPSGGGAVTSVFGRTGAVVATLGDYTTSLVTEGTNLYFTDARARAAITGGASSIVISNLLANRALLSDASGKVAVSAVTNTELEYVDGVTSAIQTQLNAKAPTASPTFSGNVTMPGSGIWNSSGNVGIGISTPDARLQISGPTNTDQLSIGLTDPYLRLGTDNNSNPYITANAKHIGGGVWNYYNTLGFSGQASRLQLGGGFVFNTVSGGTNPITWSERMRISNGGNVGIGMMAPYSKLSVSGGDTIPSLTHGTTALANIDNSLTDLAITIDDSTPFTASIQHRHKTLDNFSYPIALNPLGGNVGIGTTNPQTKLSVAGGIVSGSGVFANGLVKCGSISFNNTYFTCGLNPTLTLQITDGSAPSTLPILMFSSSMHALCLALGGVGSTSYSASGPGSVGYFFVVVQQKWESGIGTRLDSVDCAY